MEIIPDITYTSQLTLSLLSWGMAFIQLFWLLFFYLRIASHKEKTIENKDLPVSIIIAARNEEDNLYEFLLNILEQDYKTCEVIVGNHHLAHGKKLPLTIGIKGAKYEHLLFTDADCKPSSDQWIKQMTNKFTSKKEIVLGYAPHRKSKGFLNKVIRFDTTFIALNYLSFAKAGVPYMGVGRNLAYTKEVFMKNSGFKSHYSIQSGDDDLFIQEVAKKKNYTISLSPEAFCYSDGEKTWKDWYSQKSRHYTTSGRYSLFKKLLLGIYPLTLLLLYISLVTLIVNNWMSWISIGVISLLIVSKWLILGMAFKKLEQKSFIWSIIFWDLFYAIFTPIVYYTTEQSTATKWK